MSQVIALLSTLEVDEVVDALGELDGAEIQWRLIRAQDAPTVIRPMSGMVNESGIMGTVAKIGGYVNQTMETTDQRVEDLNVSEEEATFLSHGLMDGASIVVVDCPVDQLKAVKEILGKVKPNRVITASA